MSATDDSLEKLRAEGLGAAAVESFAHYLRLLRTGDTGRLPEAGIEPVEDVPDMEALPEDPETAREALDRVVVLKLNGGLGTSMGMTRAKALLPVRGERTFLDLIAEQVLALRARTGARIPLVLMNSFATHEDSLADLAQHEGLQADVPLDFLQNKVPKLDAETLEPVSWPADPAKEWAPPGHGDLYVALQTSGMLEQLLAQGYRWAFVSNADNLGAVLDERILAWVAREGLPFAMEVADRTAADRKGGHLARRRDGGGLVLREIAQCPDDDVEAFQDVTRHRFFNTNTLWVDLEALATELRARDGVLGLPMIVNRKTVDPADPSSPKVVQLETAMGAAIDVFADARALRVPRTRFAPVKTTDDLLGVRSDAYEVGDDGALRLHPSRTEPPDIQLDPEHFKLIDQFDARFPGGPPSLVECERLVVRGDVTFGRDVVVRGDVEVAQDVPDGTVLGS